MSDHYILGLSFPVDYVVRGEGEIALEFLCEAIEGKTGIENVPNLSWRDDGGRVFRNRVPSKIDKHILGQFPVPDFSKSFR